MDKPIDYPLTYSKLFLGTYPDSEMDSVKRKLEGFSDQGDILQKHKIGAIQRSVSRDRPELFSQIQKVQYEEFEKKKDEWKEGQISEILRIQSAFREEGLTVIPYKGPALALEFYQNHADRDWADLDFAIDEKDLAESGQIMKNLGYYQGKEQTDFDHVKDSRAYHIDFEWWYIEGNDVKYCVEFHWQPGFSALYCPVRFDFSSIRPLTWSQQNGGEIIGFSRIEHALYTVVHHGLVDQWCEIRHLVDLVQIISSLVDDELHGLIKRIEENRISQVFKIGVSLCRALLNFHDDRLSMLYLPKRKFSNHQRAIEDQIILGDWSQKPKKLFYYLGSRDSFRDTLVSTFQFGKYALKELRFKWRKRKPKSKIEEEEVVRLFEGMQMSTERSKFEHPKLRYTQDWFTHAIPAWEEHVLPMKSSAPLRMIEIGSYEGLSAFWFFQNILHETQSHLTCIDIQFQNNFWYNMNFMNENQLIEPIEGESQEILPTLPKNSYDLIYIDGGHSQEQVKIDLALSWPLLKVHGIIILDDYGGGFFPGVKVATDAFLKEKESEIEVLHLDYQVILKKE